MTEKKYDNRETAISHGYFFNLNLIDELNPFYYGLCMAQVVMNPLRVKTVTVFLPGRTAVYDIHTKGYQQV